MKPFRHVLSNILMAACLCAALPSHSQTAPRTLILYDAPVGDRNAKLGLAYAIMLRNLLGHFSASVDMLPVQQYTENKVESYAATFYLGSYYDHQLPTAFLHDVVQTTKTVVWFKYNIWQLAWNPSITPSLAQRYGMGLTGTRGLNAAPTPSAPNPGFFDDVLYKNKEFIKYYAYDANSGAISADPDIGVMQAVDASKANSLVTISNRATSETVPYVMRSANFWYVADMPFSYIGPRDRYLVIADLLHDILGMNHEERHDALVRIEDLRMELDTDSTMIMHWIVAGLSDSLFSRAIPFSMAVIPHYADPLITGTDYALADQAGLRSILDYATVRGGDIVQNGYTHQYANIINPYSGRSGQDLEFWLAVDNKPVPEDSQAWAAQRMLNGKNEFIASGYTPFAWETPGYQASAKASRAAAATFAKTYQRVVYYTADTPDFGAAVARDFAVGQFYPYVIQQDYYGQKVIPENLGAITYDGLESHTVYTWQDVHLDAQFALAVRDGYASFYVYPYFLNPYLSTTGFQDLQNLIDGIQGLGYTWKAAKDVD